jgi:hypothetical protein
MGGTDHELTLHTMKNAIERPDEASTYSSEKSVCHAHAVTTNCEEVKLTNVYCELTNTCVKR